MLIYKHLTNTSLNKMKITSRNLIKWKINKWVLQWCPINKIKNKNNKKNSQWKLNHITLLKILNKKKLTSTNWTNNKKTMKRTTLVTLMTWLLKKWDNLWYPTINKTHNILSKNILSHLLKLPTNKVSKNWRIVNMNKSINKKINKIFLTLVTSNRKKWAILSYLILIMPKMKHNLNNINLSISKKMMMSNHKSHKLEGHKTANHNMCHQKSQTTCQETILMLLTVSPHKEWVALWCHKTKKLVKELMLSVVWLSRKWVSLWCHTNKRKIMSLMHSIVWLSQRSMTQWCLKIKTRILTGSAKKKAKNNQVINWKKVKKTNNKDSAISRSTNLNTCHNLKFPLMNKKSNQHIMSLNKAHQKWTHYKKNYNHKLALSLCRKFFQVTFY